VETRGQGDKGTRRQGDIHVQVYIWGVPLIPNPPKAHHRVELAESCLEWRGKAEAAERACRTKLLERAT